VELILNIGGNVGHMSSGGFRSSSLLTEKEATIETLNLAIHESRHYLYAVLWQVFTHNRHKLFFRL
jgi:hypothetical protein